MTKTTAVTPIPYAFPDGQERILRFTAGATKRIAKRFGTDFTLQKALQENGDGIIPELAHLMMYDDKGKPPALSLPEMEEMLPPNDNTLLAAVLSAFEQGRRSPNEIAAVMNPPTTTETETPSNGATSNGSTSGDSVSSASESSEANSGTATCGVNSTPSDAPTESTSVAAPTT